MRILTVALLLLVFLPFSASAQTTSAEAEIRKLLNDFLVGASHNEATVHDRFWAEDLIYTGSSGRRVSKADIMRDVRSAQAPQPSSAAVSYTAEDVRVQQYGDTAIVAFRLIGTTTQGDQTRVARYLNSGTFLKRDGQWRVVNWQATRLPRSDEEARSEVTQAALAFVQSLARADKAKLEDLTEEGFVLSRCGNTTLNRKQFLESQLDKYPDLSAQEITAAIHGDMALIRGTLNSSSAAKDVTGPFTLIVINRDGRWRVLSLQTD